MPQDADFFGSFCDNGGKTETLLNPHAGRPPAKILSCHFVHSLLRKTRVPFLTHEITLDETSPLLDARADRCVQELVGGSRSYVTGLFDHDCVKVNGSVEIDAGRKLAVGDLVSVRLEAGRRYSPKRRPQPTRHRGFSIVYEDREIIIVDKSADLLTVPTDGREPHTLIYRVNEHIRHEGRGRGAFLVHRLDRGVSGLMVFGKTREMADAVQSQFQQRKPERQYDAIVTGHVVQQQGEFRTYLATGKNLNRFSTEDEEEGELAVTHYNVLRNFPRTAQSPAVTHVAVQLETGRRNQIRVHFAEAGHTVLGDSRYRAHLWKDIPWPHKRLALHASTLAFVHPISCEMLRFSSPLPPEMTNFVRYIQQTPKPKQR